MKVLKFGGTSVGSAKAVQAVFDIVSAALADSGPVWVVVSAMSGITNQLLALSESARKKDAAWLESLAAIETRHRELIEALLQAYPERHERALARCLASLAELKDLAHGIFLLQELSPRSSDLIAGFGERLSAAIIAEYFTARGVAAEFLDTRQLIVTDENHGLAHVDFETTNSRIVSYAKDHPGLQIATGFIAATAEGITTTLGRGGSDFTAAILGAALNVSEIQIWSDVDGIMTTDPSKVKAAFPLPELSFEEAMELSHFGTKVINPPTLAPAMERKIPIRSLNTFNRDFPGTVIRKGPLESDFASRHLITGISSIEHVALLRIQGSGMVGVRGISSRLFAAISSGNINVILITQASSEHSICIAVQPQEAPKAKRLIDGEFALEIRSKMIDPVLVEQDLSIVAVVGENMIRTRGIAGRLFSILGHNGINVVAIAQGSSELNISVVLSAKDERKALNALHAAFFSPGRKRINVFMLGTGLVGGTLLEQIRRHHSVCLSRDNIDICLVALGNSRRFMMDADGLALDGWKERLSQGQCYAGAADFVRMMKECRLPDSILVDCTASADLVSHYIEILHAGISIVTPNKLANSGSMLSYNELRATCARYRSRFFYETNVGAGLPVINTIQELLRSGQQFRRIEGILSGTLSYIFTTFQAGGSFSAIVGQAQALGYTEPDPRIDLGGLDVARKLLILVREAGHSMELADVEVEPLLPAGLLASAGGMAGNVADFLASLPLVDSHFEDLRRKAEANNCVLRFVASWQDGRASIGLREIPPAHPFYNLRGSENIIALTTDQYDEYPMVIKGPGAGAAVTASGVFAELVRFGNTSIRG